jgi:phosphatidylserine decarboxylase
LAGVRALLRKLGFAEYGGDEMVLAVVACGTLGWALYSLVHPLAAPVVLIPFGIVLWFFRDPERAVPAEADLFVSPADGTITDVIEVDEPAYLKGRALRVGMFLSPLNVHVNRVPCDGEVEYLEYRVGEFLPAYNPNAPERNESQALGLKLPDGSRILVKQITGVLARRIVCEAREGQRFSRGQRYGMIKLGSRTELYVPANGAYRVEVKVGEKAVGGVTVFVRKIAAAAPVENLETAIRNA